MHEIFSLLKQADVFDYQFVINIILIQLYSCNLKKKYLLIFLAYYFMYSVNIAE